MLLAVLQIRHFIYFARAFIFSARAFTGSSRELGRIPPRVLHFSALVAVIIHYHVDPFLSNKGRIRNNKLQHLRVR